MTASLLLLGGMLFLGVSLLIFGHSGPRQPDHRFVRDEDGDCGECGEGVTFHCVCPDPCRWHDVPVAGSGGGPS